MKQAVKNLLLDLGCPEDRIELEAPWCAFVVRQVAHESGDGPLASDVLRQSWELEFPRHRQEPWQVFAVALEIASILGIQVDANGKPVIENYTDEMAEYMRTHDF